MCVNDKKMCTLFHFLNTLYIHEEYLASEEGVHDPVPLPDLQKKYNLEIDSTFFSRVERLRRENLITAEMIGGVKMVKLTDMGRQCRRCYESHLYYIPIEYTSEMRQWGCSLCFTSR